MSIWSSRDFNFKISKKKQLYRTSLNTRFFFIDREDTTSAAKAI